RARQVARIAPRTLLSSKEFIEFRLPKGAKACGIGDAAGDRQRRWRYRFARPVATRISAPAAGFPAPSRGVQAQPDMPRTIILIPARLASTRLPGKPLADIAGLPMIVQVL